MDHFLKINFENFIVTSFFEKITSNWVIVHLKLYFLRFHKNAHFYLEMHIFILKNEVTISLLRFIFRKTSSILKAPSLSVHSSSVHPFVTFFLRGNNSALGGHRALPKVANERYCYIFFIFGVGIAGTGNWHRRRQKKNILNSP